MEEKRNRRRIHLVDPRFQLKFASLITLLVLVSSVFVPVFVLSSIDQSLVQKEKEVKPEVLEEIRKFRNEFLSIIVIFEALVIFFAFMIALYHSHRIVGPISRLCDSIKLIRAGGRLSYLKFRKKDNFSEVAQEYNLALDYLNKQRDSTKNIDQASIEEITSRLKKVRPFLPSNEQEELDETIEKVRSLC